MKIQETRNKKQISSNNQITRNNLEFGIWSLSVSCILLLVSLFFTTNAQAALLYTSAANQVVYQDQTFVIDWYLDTRDEQINTVQLKLNFSKENLEILSTSVGNSAFNLWIKSPTFSNDTGIVELTAGISGGVKSNKVPIFSTTIKPKQTGPAKIIMDESSTLLLSDGEGTGTSLIFNQLGFEVHPSDAAPINITSSTHPDPTSWYKHKNISLEFQPKIGEEYSFSFSSNTEIIPDDKSDDIKEGKLKFENIPDGIYYFKLNSKLGPANWQEAGVFRVQIDTTPPGEFTPAVASDPSIFDGKPFVSFTARDNTSGVSHYEVKFGSLNSWKSTKDTVIKIPGVVLGDYIEIKVVDAAGNEQIRRISINEIPNKSLFQQGFVWVIIIVAIILAVLSWLAFRFLKKKYSFK